MSKLAKCSLKAACGGAALFGAVFSIYFFNLDMKFMAYCVDPILQKIYDSRTPNYYV